MLKTIKRYISKFIYALPFGMKGGNDEIMGNKDSFDGSHVIISENLSQTNLGESLLKGEVTQEVEELRYSMYKIADESQEYTYLGNGYANHKKKKEDIILQENKIICEGVLHELNRVGEYSKERYTLNIEYNGIPKFKIEKYAKNFIVDLHETELSLVLYKDTNIPEERMCVNYYKDFEKNRDIHDNIKTVTFITNHARGSKDDIRYILHDLSLTKLEETDKELIVSFRFQNWSKDFLLEKFYSKTQDEKYKNKTKKQVSFAMNEGERICHCGECGKEINKYDADITAATIGGYPLCQDCLKKIMELKEENDE